MGREKGKKEKKECYDILRIVSMNYIESACINI